MVNGKKRVGSNSLCQGPITSSIDYQMAKPGPAGRRTNHRRSNQPLQIGKYSAISIDYHHTSRAWVSMGAAVAWHPPKFWVSPLVPADFVVLNTNWHPQSSFYVISGTLSFKFLTQALVQIMWEFFSNYCGILRMSKLYSDSPSCFEKFLVLWNSSSVCCLNGQLLLFCH